MALVVGSYQMYKVTHEPNLIAGKSVAEEAWCGTNARCLGKLLCLTLKTEKGGLVMPWDDSAFGDSFEMFKALGASEPGRVVSS